MTISEITHFLQSWAPLSLQESYDNSGLLVGSHSREVSKALITLDVTEEVMEEAISNGCNLVIAHHPVIFSGIKRLTGNSMTERIVMRAIKHDIAIYAIHTNLDNTYTGVNQEICRRIGLVDTRILEPKPGLLRKLVTFCPDLTLDNGITVAQQVSEAVWDAGAGHIGNYDRCSYSSPGWGHFRGLQGARPFIGNMGEMTRQPETRLEFIFPAYYQDKIVKALISNHPYEEVAYDIYPLENAFGGAGAGMIGELEEERGERSFLLHLKNVMRTPCVRYSPMTGRPVKKVAVCGGSGSFLLKTAIAQGADALVTADFKYHQFFDAENKILIADIGHYESEQFTIGLIFDKLIENFPNFALLKSAVVTNPVNYI